jgi:flagellar biosynthetic protein FliR
MMILPAAKLWLYAMALVRLSGVMVIAPVFSSVTISLRIRLSFLFVFSIFVAMALPPIPKPSGGFPAIMAAVVAEFGAGVLIGSGYYLAMSALSIAGELIGLQMGLGSASLFDPNNGGSGAILANFLVLLYAVVFLSLDGHHHLLRAFMGSYAVLPAGSASLQPGCLTMLLRQSGEMLSTGCCLAAPVLIPLFLITLTTALISRAFPQANVVALTYGVSAMLGLILLAAAVPAFQDAIKDSIRNADVNTVKMLKVLAQ